MRVDALGLPITLDLEGARAIVIGDDDEERARKLGFLDDAGAQIQTLLPAQFSDDKIDGARIVLFTRRDSALAAKVALAARKRGALVWCSDEPGYSDFAMPAIARVGRARIAVSTGGSAPSLARRMREALEEALGDGYFAHFLERLAALRVELQREVDNADERKEQLARAVEQFALTISVRYPDWLRSELP